MTETLEKIIGNGFSSWMGNLNICMPLVISYLIQLLLMFFTVVIGMIILIGEDLSKQMVSMTDEQIIEFISSVVTEKPIIVILLIGLFFIITMLVDSYFRAGAIGMCKNATICGDTTIEDMFNTANKSFIHIFMANLFIVLMILAGIIFIVPGVLLLQGNVELIETTQLGAGIMLLIIGLIIWFLYGFIIQMVFSVVLYAIVLEETGALEGVYRGYDFFMKNKLNVVLIWLFTNIISISVAFIFYFFSNIISLAGNAGLNIAWSFSNQLIILVTIQPLILIWWTRLYLVRTGKDIYIDELLSDTW
jgi:hypothetical protein